MGLMRSGTSPRNGDSGPARTDSSVDSISHLEASLTGKSIVHLHNHSQSSRLDGLSTPKEMIAEAEKQGMPAIAIADHGSMADTYNLYKAAKDTGVKPIFGIEAYLAPDVPRSHKKPVRWADGGSDDVSGKGAYTHLTLLAETDEGLHNLMKMSSEAYATGFYRAPRMDTELLSTYGKGIIASTGCPSGEVQTWLRIGNYKKAIEAAAKFRDLFDQGNLYVEVMDHGLDIEKRVLPDLLKIAKDLHLPIIATNDSHYTHASDHTIHDAMLAIDSGSTLDDPDRFRFDGTGYYIKTAAEMRALWDDRVPEACDNTLLIAERVTATFHEGRNYMPKFDVPEGHDEASWLKEEVRVGLERRFPNGVPAEHLAQAEYEVGVIVQMGFPGYFLVVADFINWAKAQGIRVGPGRGSAAGSVVAWAMGITDLDPIRHRLMFERFLNPERVTMPDVDIDFDDRYRERVIEYVRDKYGDDKVALIITRGYLKAKSSLKDAGRVLGYPYVIADQLAKAYPPPIVGRELPLADAFDPANERYDEATEFRNLVQATPEAQAILEVAKGLAGVQRQTGLHAAGVIMSCDVLSDHVPMMRRTSTSPMSTAFEYPTCETLGLLKMDFLGLSNLGTIDMALAEIKKNRGIDIDLHEIGESLNDKKTFDLLARGDTLGVFQLDSPPMRSLLRLMKVDAFEDISAVLALYRPGPMAAGAHTSYALRKTGQEPITPIHPELEQALEPILGETYGLCVTGDTLVWDATAGQRVRIDSIAQQVEDGTFKTFGINERGVPQAYPVTHWFATGRKPVLRVQTRTGQVLRLSADHPVLTPSGWKKTGDLRPEVDLLAVPNSGLGSQHTQTLTEEETRFLDYVVGGDTNELCLPESHSIQTSVGHHEGAVCANQSWTIIDTIVQDGEEDMYDITVEGVHNFLANGLVVHNCIYQESVMKIAQDLAGYSLGKADLLRRAMGKKDKEKLKKEFDGFKAGMLGNGYSEEAIQALWDVLLPFSDYAFNRAHTAAYGLISYWTAYLKANFPAEYMASLLSTNRDDKGKTAVYLAECRRMGLEVKSPDVNLSSALYTAEGDSIRVGLAPIKTVGMAGVEVWLEERATNGPASDFADFLMRGGDGLVQKRAVDALIRAGAFDSMGHSRAALVSVAEHAVDQARALKKKPKIDGQMSLFDELDDSLLSVTVPNIPEWDARVRLAAEREMLGLYVSGHPLADLVEAHASWAKDMVADVKASPGSNRVVVAGLVTAFERRTTKAGEPWARFTLEDLDDSIEVFCFPKTYAQCATFLREDAVVAVTAKSEQREDDEVTLMASQVTLVNLDRAKRSDPALWMTRKRTVAHDGSPTPVPAAGGDTRSVYVRVAEADLDEETVGRLGQVLKAHPGSRPVVLGVMGADGQLTRMRLGDEFRVDGRAELGVDLRILLGHGCV